MADPAFDPLPGRAPAYRTALGCAYEGDSLDLLSGLADESVDLIVSSPPFALQREKEYGNTSQAEYVSWLGSFVSAAIPKMAPTGSLVLEIGGAYEAGTPARSLYPFRVLMHLCDDLGLVLLQDFYWNNRSKLPSPIEWVNKRKLRAKDTAGCVFVLGRTPWAKVDTTRVLTPYSAAMLKLIEEGEKEDRLRPSGHVVSGSFGKDNGGALPSNLLDFPNTESNGRYLDSCRLHGGKMHPARFPFALPEFFVKLLTDPGDVVLDIFAGSNTTGEAAESLRRRWISFERRRDYVASSVFRLAPEWMEGRRVGEIHAEIAGGGNVDLARERRPVPDLFEDPLAASP